MTIHAKEETAITTTKHICPNGPPDSCAEPNDAIPARCPWCGGEWTYEDDGDAENGPSLSVYCSNPDCPGDPNDPEPPAYFFGEDDR